MSGNEREVASEPWRAREPRPLVLPALSTVPRQESRHFAGRDGTTDTCQSRVETEMARIHAEMLSVCSNDLGKVSIPSGREFEEPPDPAEESAYDALEKAYNLAFTTVSPAKLSQLEKQDREPCETMSPDHDDTARLLGRKLESIQRAEQRDLQLCMGRFTSSKRSRENRATDGSLGRPPSFTLIAEASRAFAATRRTRQRVLQHLAGACRNRVLSKSKHRPLATTAYDPLKIQTRDMVAAVAPQEMVALMTPIDEHSYGEQSESKALVEYLVAELSSATGYFGLTTMEQSNENAGQGRHVRREHDRAVSIYEAEMRMFSDAGYRLGDASLLQDPRDGDLNPFQWPNDSGNSLWKSSLKNVDFSDCQNAIRHDRSRQTPEGASICHDTQKLSHRGINAIVVGREQAERESACLALLYQKIPGDHSYPQHILVTSPSTEERWRTLLAKHNRVQERSKSRVIVASLDSMARDSSIRRFDICVFDVTDEEYATMLGSDQWKIMLALKCHQRVLLCAPSIGLDARVLAVFAFPSHFSSLRRLQAWNCASLSKRLVASLVSSVRLCALPLPRNSSVLTEWSLSVANTTLDNVRGERQVLGSCVIAHTTELTPALIPPEGRQRHTPATRASSNHFKRSKDSLRNGPIRARPSSVSNHKQTKRPHAMAFRMPRKRARKRISRCGLCKGCLAEDCMKCGHCQDMKKYGGPGLRKQSCKRRKCSMPQSHGMKRLKPSSKNGEHDSSSEADGTDNDSAGELDVVDAADESDSSVDKRATPRVAKEVHLASPLVDGFDSDSHHEDTGDINAGGDEGEGDEASADYDGKLRGVRSRVMRCGKCKGCTSGDCMKCIHCQDMKKYGGPGLRKQSCKNRKCIEPKVVLLNQLRDKQDESADGLEPWNVEEKTDGDPVVSAPTDVTSLFQLDERLQTLSVAQECELVVRKYLFFRCDACSAVFTSQKMLDSHEGDVHGQSTSSGAWSVGAELFMANPAHQLPNVVAARKSVNPEWQPPSIRAYAKLDGLGFEYFFLKSYAVLGRLTHEWRHFYRSRGISDFKGLPGGQTDCHVGDDTVIASAHALIKWDDVQEVFTIECLSSLSPISVNGKEVNFSSKAHQLRSRDLIQVGAATAFFLLPVSGSRHTTSTMLPKREVQAWLSATVDKRRASRVREQKLASQSSELAASLGV